MIIFRTLLFSSAIAGLAVSAAAAPEGKLDTLPRGNYGCELPGNAAGPTGIPVEDADFKIVNASSYTTPRGSGTYLLTGKIVKFTSGPLRGKAFKLEGKTYLRELNEGGSRGRMRCVLQGR